MNILTPLNREDQIPTLVQAGATEFYMGFFDSAWQERYGKNSDINRLTLFKESANRYTISDVQRISKKIKDEGAELYITLNAPGYSEEQIADLTGYLSKLADSGVAGVIVSEPDLIPLLDLYGLKAVASTMCGIFNPDLAEYYKDLGIKRAILPREMTSEETADLMGRVPDLEYEVFLMRNGCRFSDANCLGLHGGPEGALCGSLRFGEVTAVSRHEQQNESGIYGGGMPQMVCSQMMSGIMQMPRGQMMPGMLPGQLTSDMLLDTHWKFCHEYHVFACGQCAIWRFLQMGVRALKIVGRMDDSVEILNEVKLTAENIRIAKQASTEEEYLSRMCMPADPDSYCKQGMSCYYPEVRWG